MFEIFDTLEDDRFVQEWAQALRPDIFERNQMTQFYDHTALLKVTVRTANSVHPNTYSFLDGIEKGLRDKGWPSTSAHFESTWTATPVYDPNAKIGSTELAAYHAKSAAFFGRIGKAADKPRRALRKAVIGREVIASQMTFAEFEKIMAAMDDAS